MDKLSKDILLNFLQWEAERSSELLVGMTKHNADWAIVDRVNWLNEKIEEVKGGQYE